jgi:hypothetical protein
MQQLTRELLSPFPSRINSNVNDSADLTLQWVQAFELHAAAALEKYKHEKLTWMTARFYPTAEGDHFFLSDKFNTLLFAMDDSMDHLDTKSDIIQNRETFVFFINACLRVMKGETAHIKSHTGFLAALDNLWVALTHISTQQWQENFIRSIEKMFNAALWSFDNVAMNHVPSITEFYNMRPFLGAAHISTDLILVVEQFDIPDHVLNHSVMKELIWLCQITVCLANDIFSYEKESKHLDKHNMVAVIQEEKGFPVDKAIAETVKMHNDDVKNFVELVKSRPSFGEHDAEVDRFIMILTAIMKGNIDWSLHESGRYDMEGLSISVMEALAPER